MEGFKSVNRDLLGREVTILKNCVVKKGGKRLLQNHLLNWYYVLDSRYIRLCIKQGQSKSFCLQKILSKHIFDHIKYHKNCK